MRILTYVLYYVLRPKLCFTSAMCLTNTARELEIDAQPKAKDHPEIGRETLTTQNKER